MKRSYRFLAIIPVALFATAAGRAAPAEPQPATPAAPAASGEEAEVEVDVTSAVRTLPVLLLLPASEKDRAFADEVRRQIEFTGMFNTPAPQAVGINKPGLPDRNKWPGLAQAAVIVEREVRAEPSFPIARSSSYLRNVRDEVRLREHTEFPGTSTMTAAIVADAIMEDVTGVRSHMSGKMLVTDATTRGERAIRVLSPDGQRNRRISGFGSLARGGDFGPGGTVFFAAEDASGKLSLFREGQASSVSLRAPGYVQSISFSPDAKFVAVSMGQGNRVQTWTGADVDHLMPVDLGEGKTALSPSIAQGGEVVHAVGPTTGPMTVMVGSKAVSPPGLWTAQPAFCSTRTDKRVVYMARAGAHWDIRITSLTNGLTHTVGYGMSPSCSPDGRTVAFWALGRTSKGPGVYTVSDEGGMPHRVWSGEASGLRWAAGEPLPAGRTEKVVPTGPAPAR